MSTIEAKISMQMLKNENEMLFLISMSEQAIIVIEDVNNFLILICQLTRANYSFILSKKILSKMRIASTIKRIM